MLYTIIKMNLNDAFVLRDTLKKQLSVVEEYIAIAKAHGGTGPPPPVGVPPTTAPEPPRDNRNLFDHPGQEYGGVGKAVRKAIAAMPDTFTIPDLCRYFEKHGPILSANQVSTVINRMVKKDGDMVHERGKGSRATIFKKTASLAQ
jgi:hypothetical protein